MYTTDLSGKGKKAKAEPAVAEDPARVAAFEARVARFPSCLNES